MSETLEFVASDLLPGVSHALVATLVGHPFDTVKTVHQARRFGNAHSNFSVFRAILRTDGTRGLYRGGSAPLIAHLTKRPFQFPLYERFVESGMSPFLAGAGTASFATVLGVPLQNLKVNIQSRGGAEYPGHSRFVIEVYRQHGWVGMYRGFWITLSKDVAFGAVFLGSYAGLRASFDFSAHPEHQTPGNLGKAAAAGALAQSLAWTLLMPLDYVKTRVQRSLGDGRQQGEVSAAAVLRQTLSAPRRLRTLWTGLAPAILRTFPVSGCAMLSYEATRWAISTYL